MPDQTLSVPQVYGFQHIHLIVAGQEILDFAKGDNVIECAYREDQTSDEIGADGNMAVVVTANKSGTIKFKLQQTSRSLKFMNGLAIAQTRLANVAGLIPVLMQDSLRQDKGAGTFGYITKPPPVVRGEKLNDMEWTIVVQRLDLFMGLT